MELLLNGEAFKRPNRLFCWINGYTWNAFLNHTQPIK